MGDEELDAILLTKDSAQIVAWVTDHASDLTEAQAAKIVPLTYHSVSLNDGIIEGIGPAIGKAVLANNNMFHGAVPVLQKLSKHCQFMRTTFVMHEAKVIQVFVLDDPNQTIMDRANALVAWFEKNRRLPLDARGIPLPVKTICESIVVADQVERSLAVLQCAAMMAPLERIVRDIQEGLAKLTNHPAPDLNPWSDDQ